MLWHIAGRPRQNIGPVTAVAGARAPARFTICRGSLIRTFTERPGLFFLYADDMQEAYMYIFIRFIRSLYVV